MPRYVVLYHELPPGHARQSHWDLMFEWGMALRTWAMASEPGLDAQALAEPLADHRLAYLDYEGPISGDRGAVTQWDCGTYRLESCTDDEVRVRLKGKRLSGELLLRQDAAGHFWRVSLSAAPTIG